MKVFFRFLKFTFIFAFTFALKKHLFIKYYQTIFDLHYIIFRTDDSVYQVLSPFQNFYLTFCSNTIYIRLIRDPLNLLKVVIHHNLYNSNQLSNPLLNFLILAILPKNYNFNKKVVLFWRNF